MKRIAIFSIVGFLFWYVTCLPTKLFKDRTATVLLDKDGALLGAKIAEDGQWRFAKSDSIPQKFETCILEFEDRNFYKHYGVSINGIGRAIVQNCKRKRIVSGGSTITMQLARIMRKNPKRTFHEKIIEMLIATRLETRYSKKQILNFYACNAPFGNNVVGLEAASWRYYGRGPEKLSWAESATLAVLPNAPGLIYPGKNHKRLLEKRNRLLKRLFDIKKIDETTYQLSLVEPLPNKPLPLPQLASHLLNRLIKEGNKGKTIISTIDISLQEKASEILRSHSLELQENKIYNGAIIITSIKTGNVLAYIGNTNSTSNDYSSNVDCANAPRSTGSILKPFLYAKCMEDGLINPGTILPDVPTNFGNFSPKNFSQSYDGAVPANQCLSRSLNIPFVRLLNEYGLEKFHHNLKQLGLSTLNKSAKHYGLSLILGGAEAKLWDLNTAYTEMAQSLEINRIKKANYISENNASEITYRNHPTINTGCVYATLNAMVDVNRPDEDGNWRIFSSSQKIAWKTGTSFGFRDAWAIGITPDYVVSVWVGNADGEGRPGLTGINAAAPLMFDVFGQLPKSTHWFKKPDGEIANMLICKQSGSRASELCLDAINAEVPNTCMQTTACGYHHLIHLTKNGLKRVDSECEQPSNMQHVAWFVLPPIIEKYYKFNHPDYKILPEFKAECLAKVSDKAIALLYPKPNNKIYVPIEIDGKIGRTIFEATHRNSNTKIYWHLDNEYIGETKEIHQLALNPAIGNHKLLLIDENGISYQIKFEVMSRN